MEQIVQLFRESPQRKTKNVMFAFYFIFTVCLSDFYFGYTLVYLSGVDFNIIAEQFKIDFDLSVAQGIFQGIMPIGGAVGAISSAYFIGLFSRRNIIFVFNALGVILCLASLVSDYKVFLVVRFLQGAVCGLFSAVVPTIIKEISPHDISSITGSFANAAIITGLFFLYLFSYLLKLATGDPTGGSSWKVLFLFPVVTFALQTLILIRVFPFETPKYLAHNNKTAELRQLMGEFYKIEHVAEMYEHYMKHHGQSVTPEEEKHRSQSQEGDSTGKKVSKCALIYGIFYAFLCPMAGINVIVSYGGEVVSSIAPSLRSIMPAILMLFYLFCALISMAFINKYGRKSLTYYGTIGLSLNLVIIAWGYFIRESHVFLSQMVIVVFLFVYLVAFGLTYAPVMWIWVAEALLPHTIGYAVMINWSGAAIVMIFFPILIELLPHRNPAYIFLFFAAYLASSLIVTDRLMIETKDKFQHEIMEEYKKLDEKYFGSGGEKEGDEGLQLAMINKKP